MSLSFKNGTERGNLTMSNATTHKNELIGKRLTWNELKKHFPNQWVGLSDVEYEDNDGVTIESGVLKFMNKSQTELIGLALDGVCVSRYIPCENEEPEVILVECGGFR